jgi:hypothetical protein
MRAFSRSIALLLLAGAALVSSLLSSGSAQAAFGVRSGSFFAKAHAPVPLLEVEGNAVPYLRRADVPGLQAAPPLNQAGAHPDATASFALNASPHGVPEDNAKDVEAALPPGFLGNPSAAPACSRDAFAATYRVSGNAPSITDGCPVASQVGVATLTLENGHIIEAAVPVYRVTTAYGSPASFGMPYFGLGILLNPTVRSDGDYGLTVTASDINAAGYAFLGATVTFWGVPAAAVHDGERLDLEVEGWAWGAPSPGEPKPFLSNPTDCHSGPLTTLLTVDSWQEAGRFLPADPSDPDYSSAAPQPVGCAQLHFGGPSAPVGLTLQPAVHAADTPSGYEAKLHLPYGEDPDGLADPPLRDITVNLPEGVVANAASAVGLAACTEAQIGYLGSGYPMPNPIRFDEVAPGCPDASKIGTVVVHTPLLEEPLAGSVYLARQEENPFGSLLAIYLAIDDPETGIVVKLAGEVTPDPRTGRLTTTFTDSPQLPFTELDLKLFGGSGAALANPVTCGTQTTTSTLTPWSAPDTPPVTATDSFQISSGPNGSPCVSDGSQLPNQPSFEAGTTTPLGGAYSPFALKLSREDGTQRISTIDTTLPAGLLGRLAGVPYCPDAQLAAAERRTGREEQQSPSCPSASEVGIVDVAAGAGPQPVHVQGKAYLAGPYKGAPLSLAIVTPALAGPFDLGTVVVRAALYVDETTARIHAVSDPIPQILAGIPLDVRQISLNLNRPEFTLNPTNCEAKEVVGTAISTLGNVASLQNRFQVGGCKGLDFKPGLKLQLSGQVKRRGHPTIKAVLTQPAGQNANIATTTVVLPKGELIDNAHIDNPCTRVQFNEGGGKGEGCPAKSILGTARAYTPLLEKPLEGHVYFRSNGGERKLPDLVVELKGQIDVQLVGFIDSVKKKGQDESRVRTRFLGVPDAPVSRFELKLAGGKRGLLINSRALCTDRAKAGLKLTGQNGGTADSESKPQVKCSWKARHGKTRTSHR